MKIVKSISESGKELKQQIKYIEQDISEKEEDLHLIIKNCPHEFRELTPKQIKNEWMSESATCLICGTDFGWRCNKSPDHVCHYFSVDGQIELFDGTKVNVPEDHDSSYENDDECIFCGMPDERK